MRYLGLDLGSKTLGMALSDPNGIIASSYKIIRHDEDYEKLVDEVDEVIKQENVEKIVLGLPKNMNNTIGFKGELSYQFKKMLESKINKEVILVDERLTTKEANNLLIKNDTSRKKKKKVVDSIAATIILQSYLGIEKNRKGD